MASSKGLIVDELRAVLDIGAGDGALARPLAGRVDRVDAVEISAAMVEAGRRFLAPGAVLAIVDQQYHQLPWQDALVEVIVEHTRNSTYDPGFSLPDALAKQGLFDIHGRWETRPVAFTQPVRDYIEQFHSTASLARELMSAGEAARFDDKVAAVVREYEQDGQLSLPITASVIWGRPVPAASGDRDGEE